MPKKPINYSNSSIYRFIYNNITYYVGSTTNMRIRKNAHKSSCNNNKNKNCVYVFMRENGWEGGWDGLWDMVLIEHLSCKDKLELHRRERHFIDEYKPSLNRNIPTRTYKERNVINKERIIINRENRYKTKSEEIKKQAKQYRGTNTETNKAIIATNRENRYKTKSEEIKKQAKQYREDNKVLISKKRKERYAKSKLII